MRTHSVAPGRDCFNPATSRISEAASNTWVPPFALLHCVNATGGTLMRTSQISKRGVRGTMWHVVWRF